MRKIRWLVAVVAFISIQLTQEMLEDGGGGNRTLEGYRSVVPFDI
jgi:hypothetical protein